MNTEEKKYLYALRCIDPATDTHIRKLMRHTGSYREAWQATAVQCERAGLSSERARFFIERRNTLHVDSLYEHMLAGPIRLVTIDDAEYPPQLQTLYDPPLTLFVRGRLEAFSLPLCALVGSRRATNYGRQVVSRLVPDIVSAGIATVSGLAVGIDTCVHSQTISSGGTTIAVLGSGCDEETVYPAFNRSLADAIVEHGGCVVSEYPPGTRPANYFFPQRNRIIAGLAQLTCVVEASSTSGALITARLALEQGKDVCAVPGNVTSENSHGTHMLIQMGASLVARASDIIDLFDLPRVQTATREALPPANNEESALLASLTDTPLHVDVIAGRTHLDISIVTRTLLIMETKGMVLQVGSLMYVKKG